MMPVPRRDAPTDATLASCLGDYRRRAKTEPIAAVWKAFRASKCGKAWLDELHRAYGHRCLYCDHAEGWTVDHAQAKSRSAAGAFAWDNFRPSCGDCNHRKNTQQIVDPVREDPRAFVVYDMTTGKPQVSSTIRPARRKKSERTRALLDFPTYNEARRAKLKKVLDVLTRLIAGERGYGEKRLREELTDGEPHRAIVRDLILGAEADLHGWSPLVRKAMRRVPDLKAWALSPLQSSAGSTPGRPRTRRA